MISVRSRDKKKRYGGGGGWTKQSAPFRVIRVYLDRHFKFSLYDDLIRWVWRTVLFLETGRLDSPHVFQKKSVSISLHPPLRSSGTPSLWRGPQP
jgi:hypothetical protein